MGSSALPRDPQIINLNRILSSQERLLLSPTTNSDALKSRYERARIRAVRSQSSCRLLVILLTADKNFDYARSLLLTVSSTKQLPKDDIQRKRDLVKRLQARLNELDHLYASADDQDCDSCDEDEEAAYTQPRRLPSQQEPSGLRQRNTTTNPHSPQATTTSSNRYSNNTAPSPPTEKSPLQSRESALASHDAEREALQSSLLSLAQQLKTSAKSFGSHIESEKGTLEATVLGLDKSVGGMEGAGGKMKQLQRDSEGWNFFQRIRLYVEVAVLWVVLVLLVFVGPKLRFSTW